MKKVLVVGGATIDTIIAYENMETLEHRAQQFSKRYLLLEEGEKIEVLAQSSCTGGGATNAAVSFLRQGYDVNLVCKIGQDLPGQQVESELRGYGLNTEYLIKSPLLGTGTSFVVPSLSGDRTVFAYRGANTDLHSHEIPEQVLKFVDFMYITSLSRRSAEVLPALVAKANELNTRVALNPGVSQLKLGSSFLKKSLGAVHTLILNYEEAQQLMFSLVHEDETIRAHVNAERSGETGATRLFDEAVKFQDVRFSLKQFFREVLALGPSVVVVTHGKSGVYVATSTQLFFQKPPAAPKVVNTLGAGDAFGSGFVGALYAGMSMSSAIQQGMVNSLSVISYSDAKTGLLTRQELLQGVASQQLPEIEVMSWDASR